MPGVIIKDGESFDQALKRFKRMCEKAGILSELKNHQHYEKPSEKKRKRNIAARRKMLRMKRFND